MSDNPKLLTHEERQAIAEDCTNLLATRKVKYMEAVALRHIPRLLRHIEALEERLRFYAETTYADFDAATGEITMGEADIDRGQRAREVLR